MYYKSMDVLPLKYITDEDKIAVGKELADLAVLKRKGFPVPDGLVIFPPEIPIHETLNTFRDHTRERFESSLIMFKKKLFEIAPPEVLISELKKHHVSHKIVWKDTLTKWVEQIRSNVWRNESVSVSVVGELSPVPVFFIGRKRSSGRVYYSSDESKIVILTDTGELGDEEKKLLGDIMERIQKGFVFHYLLEWVCDDRGIYITRVRDFDELALVSPAGAKDSITMHNAEAVKKDSVKTMLKLFVDLSEGLVTEEDADGIFLASEKIETQDQKIMKIVESGMGQAETVIFQLTNINSNHDVSSALRLIHEPELLQKEVRNYLFAKHNYTKQTLVGSDVVKNSLMHIQLGIPPVRSVSELSALKDKLKNLGVERRGNQELWVELSIPQNWIEIEKYIKEGIDGIIVDLDLLHRFLIGRADNTSGDQFYQFSAKLVLDFLEGYIGKVNKKDIRFLFKSSHALDSEVVTFCLKKGVFGLILDKVQFGGARAFVARLERHHVIDKHVEL